MKDEVRQWMLFFLLLLLVFTQSIEMSMLPWQVKKTSSFIKPLKPNMGSLSLFFQKYSASIFFSICLEKFQPQQV